jgi:putative Holliday junction resolvase
MVKRFLGLDVGDRRIGVAMSDPLGFTAQRLTLIQRQTPEQDARAIEALVNEHEAQAVVMGLPLNMDGTLGEQANKVMAFADTLKTRLCCPVHLWDERLTTMQGERILLETDTSRRKRKQVIDQLAAQLILQQYLDASRQP